MDTMSIEKYLHIHDEFMLLKRLLFDKDQLITFELISKLENCYYDNSELKQRRTKQIIDSLLKIVNGKELNDSNIRNLLLFQDEIVMECASR